MPARQVPEVIVGPAKVHGLELEPGLVETMVRDMETEDALPLLAYTLRRLWENLAATVAWTYASTKRSAGWRAPCGPRPSRC